MKHSISILVAAAFVVAGAATGMAPAQAVIKPPLVMGHAEATSGLLQVHGRHYGNRYRHMRRGGRVIHVLPRHYRARPYGYRRAPVYSYGYGYPRYGYGYGYPRYGYGYPYYRSAPGFSLEFNFGGGRRW